MKLNRPRTIAILMVVLALCTGAFWLSGCASTGGGKDADSEIESPQASGDGKAAGTDTESARRVDEGSTALKGTRGTSSAVRNEPAAATGGAGAKPALQDDGPKAGGDRLERFAAYLKQGLERILPKTLPVVNWNRVVTVLGGLVALSLIYGLAFWLARRPRRRRGASRSAGGAHIGEHARVPVAQ